MSTSIAQTYRLALEHHRAGRLGAAEQLYREILQHAPDQPDALHMLGLIAYAVGQPLVAIDLIGRAIARKPDLRGAHNNLGESQRVAGQLEDAVRSFETSIAREPKLVDAYNNLALSLDALGRHADALTAFERGLALKPDALTCMSNYAALLGKCDRTDEAMAMHERCIAAGPTFAAGWNNYAVALDGRGRLAEAEAAYRHAVALEPGLADAWNNLGNLARRTGRYDEAIASFDRALAARPTHADAALNAGLTYHTVGQFKLAAEILERARHAQPSSAAVHVALASTFARLARHADAEQMFREGLVIDPTHPGLLTGLAILLGERGEVQSAVDLLRCAVATSPADRVANDTLLLYLNYLDVPPAEVFAAHVRWGETCLQDELRIGQARSFHAHDRSAAGEEIGRPLRIGYVSADFRAHSVMYFIRPILEHHDAKRVTVHCYDHTLNPDAVSDSLRAIGHRWRRIVGMSGGHVAQQIIDDRIDILIDLGGHTADNRLDVFALRPAPVQVNYQGYPNTTGLPTIDYRFTDAIADPPGCTDAFHTERLIRLPRTNWCYAPLPNYPEASLLPADRNGFIVFGSFNNFAKVSPRTAALWARTLHAVPDSKLLLKANGLSDAATRARVLTLFDEQGIGEQRLILVERTETLLDHLLTYHRVDVALDTTPYHGTTTTCEAMWMGVPVITLIGETHASRVGASLLRNANLSRFAAESEDEFVAIAKSLATDRSALAAMRGSLRRRMAESDLCDAGAMCRDLEYAYESMWRGYPDAGGNK